MASRLNIAIVGPGRLGTVLARALDRAGYRVAELVYRDERSMRRHRGQARPFKARACTLKTARLEAGLIWFCVPDRSIKSAARQLASVVDWKGKIVFHSSGALPSDELDVLRRKGASAASVHPLMTFVRDSAPPLPGVPFALEGDARAVRVAGQIARALGGVPFVLGKKRKAAYHAWGTFVSPLFVAALVTSELVARKAGLARASARKKMLPILRQTLENYTRLGPARAFSGPIIRGDTAVVEQHLRALKDLPEARRVYAALASVALRSLPAGNKKELSRVLRAE